MKKFIRIAGGYIQEIWNDPFSKPVYWVLHFLMSVCWGFFAVLTDINDLYLPWASLRVPAMAVIVILATCCSAWVFGAGICASVSGKTSTGQVLLSSTIGYVVYFTLELMEQRPLWVLGLLIIGILAGIHVPAAEYANRAGGGSVRTGKLRYATALRRINTLLITMMFSVGLLMLSDFLGPSTVSVRGAVRNGEITVTEEYWSELNEGQRFQLLELILEKECAGTGIDRPELILDPELPENTRGGFLETGYCIYLNADVLKDDLAARSINTILHEFRHCWQYDLSLRAEDPTLYEGARELAVSFRDSFANYLTAADSSYEIYQAQTVETDARHYAAERLGTYYSWPLPG